MQGMQCRKQALGVQDPGLAPTAPFWLPDNHLVLWDLRPEGITGSKMEKACDLCHITLNKNAGALWVAAGTPALLCTPVGRHGPAMRWGHPIVCGPKLELPAAVAGLHLLTSTTQTPTAAQWWVMCRH